MKMQVLEDKPDLSRWSLKYKAFGQDLEYSWLARNMQVNMMIETFADFVHNWKISYKIVTVFTFCTKVHILKGFVLVV